MRRAISPDAPTGLLSSGCSLPRLKPGLSFLGPSGRHAAYRQYPMRALNERDEAMLANTCSRYRMVRERRDAWLASDGPAGQLPADLETLSL